MTLENTFYTLGIIFMLLMIFLMVGVIAMGFYIKNKITHLHDMVEEKINSFEAVSAAASLGTAVAKTAINKVKDAFSKKPS